MVTIQDVMEKLTDPLSRKKNTVDTLLFGKPETEVKGIATTFVATHQVIRQAVDLGVNLLISHEGIFYSHVYKTDGLAGDSVYEEKRRLIEDSGIAVFRFHDHWHLLRPDGIMLGLIQALGWQTYVEKHHPSFTILNLPLIGSEQLARSVKKKLDLPFLRVIGDLSATCNRVGVFVGYRGSGDSVIPIFQNEDIDLAIVGEGPEWETPEYVRDAVHQGKSKALFVLGHAESEEPGMRYLAELIKNKLPQIPVHFIPERPVYQII